MLLARWASFVLCLIAEGGANGWWGLPFQGVGGCAAGRLGMVWLGLLTH